MDELDRALREHFGFESFRPNQREVIGHLLAGRHTLAVLPTGLGKSLCYQLPAQLLPGLTLVISPLIALMQDQISALERRGFQNVTSLSSALSQSEISRRFNDIEQGQHKLIYVAPERFDSPRFQQLMKQMEISLVVIDEAHCISQWGHDFRPHYRTLLTRLPELRRATFLAVTATATPEVQNDIAASLALPSLERVIANFDRPNLRFETIRADQREEKDRQLIELLNSEDGTMIVYASTRKEAAATHQLLNENGFSAALYHAGLSSGQRTDAQQRFLQDGCRIIVATVAFGLGIDKPNVRRVIHYNVPGSLENYYQEAGRAGRDGAAAVCTLFYSQSDVRVQRFLLDQAYPEPKVMVQLYAMLREASPSAISVSELATASQTPELAVNAVLQLLHGQRRIELTADGKYVLAENAEVELKLDVRELNARRFRANERLKKMISYALDQKCRRAAILNYFGQQFAPPCGSCDVCVQRVRTLADALPMGTAPDQLIASEASDQVARAILKAVLDLNGKFGRSMVAAMLAGSKSERIAEFQLNRNPHYSALQLHTQKRVTEWIDELVDQELLRVTAEEYPRLTLTPEGKGALGDTALIALSGFVVPQTAAKLAAASSAVTTILNSADWRLQVELWRLGGEVPDVSPLQATLQNWQASEHGDLIVAINALKDLGCREITGSLLALLRQTTNGNLLGAICEALGQFGADSMTEELPVMLTALLDDERPGVRRAAVRALGRLRVQGALGRIELLAQSDASDSVKLSAQAAALLIKKETNQ